MKEKNAIFTATFIGYERLSDNLPYRRLHLTDVRNSAGISIRKDFFIDETDELQLDINENKIICFLADDEKLENVIKFYPYPPSEKEGIEICAEVQQKGKGTKRKGVLEKLKRNRKHIESRYPHGGNNA